MPNLMQISFRRFGITTPCRFPMLSHLENLYFTDNDITELTPESFVGVSDLRRLYLTDNPGLRRLRNPCFGGVRIWLSGVSDVTCDCSVRFLKHLPQVGSDDDTPCGHPAELVGVKLGDMTPENFTCGASECVFVVKVCSEGL